MKIKITQESYNRLMETIIKEDNDILEDIQPKIVDTNLPEPDQEEDKFVKMTNKIKNPDKPRFQTLSQLAGDGEIEDKLYSPEEIEEMKKNPK